MSYTIGQIITATQPQPAFGADCKPVWHCIIPKPTPKAHEEGRAFFRAANMHAFYPSQERLTRAKKPMPREVPLLPGYLFAQCLRAPLWHVIKSERWCRDVFKVGDAPVAFPYQLIRHLQGMTVEAEKLERAKRQMADDMRSAMRPIEGQAARFVSGPFAGHVVTVESIDGAVAMFDLMGKRVAADLRGMERLA